jgi:ectoine hydroxylase-related dioxygenase (phytanoyl-CoA dioxygenase family)
VVRVKVGCVVSLPGAGEQYWHSDGAHAAAVDVDSGSAIDMDPPAALCVFVPLVDLTDETGCTEFWSGSHRYRRLLQKRGEQALPGGTLGRVRRGEAVAYDYRVVHRGTANRSGAARPIAYYLYARRGCEAVEDRNFVPRSIWDS